jgi:hypothetical protein
MRFGLLAALALLLAPHEVVEVGLVAKRPEQLQAQFWQRQVPHIVEKGSHGIRVERAKDAMSDIANTVVVTKVRSARVSRFNCGVEARRE